MDYKFKLGDWVRIIQPPTKEKVNVAVCRVVERRSHDCPGGTQINYFLRCYIQGMYGNRFESLKDIMWINESELELFKED